MNSQLTHHGILGMKWGVRRSEKQLARVRAKKEMSDDAKAVSELNKKRSSQLSNAEIRRINERKQLERTRTQLNPNTIKKGLAFTAGAATVLGTAMNLYNNSDKIVKLGKSAGDKIVNKVGNIVMKDLSKGLSKGF